MKLPQRLVLASGNAHKVVELRRMLEHANLSIEVVTMRELGDAPEIPETADTFSGNAVLKAEGIARWVDQLGLDGAAATWVLSDDSGICVDAFDGAPGVYSARFAGPEADDQANNARLVQRLDALGLERSDAHYMCVLALCTVEGAPLPASNEGAGQGGGGRAPATQGRCVLFEGRCDGVVRTARQGSGGFGYDPHFWVSPTRTFAEYAPDEKAEASHRGAALRSLVAWLAS